MIDQEVQARMNAFRGNPQGLMQRYSQSQQLLDLLALQKLKSEKEAAARQMQMQMGQGEMPTVAQQREQEVMGMAKKEVADRVGQVAQQQAKQQQENLQRMAQSGIAQAPAPNMMSAPAMAAGGIVAFAGGGDTGVMSLDELRAAYDKARYAGDFQEASRLFKVIKARQASEPRTVTTPVAEMDTAPTPQPAPQPQPQGVPSGATPPPAAQMAGVLPPPGGAGAGSLALPTGRGPMPPGAPEAQPTGIAQAAQQPQPSGLQGAFEKAAASQLTPDLEGITAAGRAGYEKDYGPLQQEQRALQQEGIAQLRARMAQQQAQQDPLGAFLGGGQGRSIGEVLRNAGRAGAGYQQSQAASRAALEDQIQKLREAEMTGRIGQMGEARAAGETRRKESEGGIKSALSPAASYVTGMANADARRDIADLQAQVRAANVQTQDAEKRKKLAEEAYARDPEVQTLKKSLESISAQMDPAKAKQAIDRMRAIQIEKYRLYELAVPEAAAAPVPAAAGSRPPLGSFKR